MSKAKESMRQEYDFGNGVRGKHAGQRFRVVGDRGKTLRVAKASKIQKAIENDLRKREGFAVLWAALDKREKDAIRAAWMEKIDELLEVEQR